MIQGRKYTVEDLIRLTWLYKWRLLLCMILGTTASVWVSLRMPDLYRSETQILVIPQRIPESYVRSTVTTRIEDRLRSLRQEILSRSRLERVIDEFNLYAEGRKTRPLEQIIEQMRGNVDVDPIRDDAFKVSFVSESPRTAMIVTERLAAMFIAENLRDRETLAANTNVFLQSELETARQKLKDTEKRVEAFRRQYSGELPAQLQTNLQVMQGLQNQIQTLTEAINRDHDRRMAVEKSIGDAVSENSLAITTAPGEAGLASPRPIDQLDAARSELRTFELRLKPEHPDIIAKRRAVAELEQTVRDSIASDPSASTDHPRTAADAIRQGRVRQYRAELDKIDKQIAAREGEIARLRATVLDYQRRIDAVPGHESEMAELMRDYETHQKLYTSLLAKQEDSKISANLERQQVGEQFRILDPAKMPGAPFSPNRPRFVLVGAVLGLVLGLVMIAALEFGNSALRTEDEIVRTLVLPVLAAIPMMEAQADRRRRRVRTAASVAIMVLAVVSATVAIVWHFGLLKGIL